MSFGFQIILYLFFFQKAASLISLDKEFINWIQLRLGYFENLDKTVDSKFQREYVSDGIAGEFLLSDLKNTSPLDYNANLINPDLILKRYKSVLNLSYLSNN